MKNLTTEHWFILQQDSLLMADASNSLPTTADLQQMREHFLHEYVLGDFNGVRCQCAEVNGDANIPSHFVWVPLRKAFERLGADWYVAIAKARLIIHWDITHQYCGKCGQQTVRNPAAFERICNACHSIFYPRISPSIIVRIQKDDQILMSRSPHFPPGAFGLIAGFIEAGESAEDAVYREVKEEVGITIKNLRYFGSQTWPFPDSLMFAFTADYAAGELVIDYSEIETAGWYRYDALPGSPSSSVSIAKKLIDDFVIRYNKP